MRWYQITEDPTHSGVLARRASLIANTRAAPVPDRNAYLIDCARGCRVLDIGVVDHTLDSGQHLHRQLAKAAGTCLGLDVLEGPLKRMRDEGFNVQVCDITRDTVPGVYDTIVCGDVIEHLDRPSALFECATRNLAPNGVLLITTPNPYYLARMRDGTRGMAIDNVDHVTLLAPSCIAEMAERSQLVLTRWRGVRAWNARTLFGKALPALARAAKILGLPEEAFCNTLIFECKRA